MPENSYPKLFCQEWNVKPHRGRQRKTWEKVIDDIFLSLRLDKCEWLEDMKENPTNMRNWPWTWQFNSVATKSQSSANSDR